MCMVRDKKRQEKQGGASQETEGGVGWRTGRTYCISKTGCWMAEFSNFNTEFEPLFYKQSRTLSTQSRTLSTFHAARRGPRIVLEYGSNYFSFIESQKQNIKHTEQNIKHIPRSAARTEDGAGIWKQHHFSQFLWSLKRFVECFLDMSSLTPSPRSLAACTSKYLHFKSKGIPACVIHSTCVRYSRVGQ